MELLMMPKKGKWEKLGEGDWKEISDSNIDAKVINLTERDKILDICKKRYISSRKRRFEVPKQKYHTHTRLKEELNKLTSEYPDIAAQYSIGSTEQGREILVLKITEDVKKERAFLKPQVKFVAGK